jgi:hypothetical protein
MGAFDVTSRRAAKRVPIGFSGWTMSVLDPGYSFTGFLDARTAPPPTEPELTCDTLAEFRHPDRPAEPWIFLWEFFTEPSGDDLEKLLEYLIRFRRECRPVFDPRLKYNVGGVLIHLTGPPQADELKLIVPGSRDHGLWFRAIQWSLRELVAVETLSGIARGELSWCVLPWIPLMRGGGEPGTIEEWKRLADVAVDVSVRLDLAADALVFSDLTDIRPEWSKALEGWNVRESQQVLEWKAEGKAEGQAETARDYLLFVLQARYRTPPPADVVARVNSMKNLAELKHWLGLTQSCDSLEQFRTAVGL